MARLTNQSPAALTMRQAIEQEKTRNAERRKHMRQARDLAAQGRGGDTEVAHVARGELIIPRALQTPELMAALQHAASGHNISLDALKIGNVKNRINPDTGAPEFGFKDWFSGLIGRNESPPSTPDRSFEQDFPGVSQAMKNYDFGPPGPDSAGTAPEMSAGAGNNATKPYSALTPSAGPQSPWRDIDKDKLTGVLYNEMSSFRGDPQKIEQAMWATANTIMNRQAGGMLGDIEKGRVASPIISERERQAIKDGNPDAKRAHDMASGIADLITSAPEAFPSQWPYTQYNHRDTPSTADHASWGTPSMVQYGPFDTYRGQQWLNIYGPKRR